MAATSGYNLRPRDSLLQKRAGSGGGDTALSHLSKRKQMSFHQWSQHEPTTTSHTDHWSKLRTKSYKLRKLPTGGFVAFCTDKDNWVQSYNRQQMGLPRSTAVTPQGTLAPVGSTDFNKYLVDRLHNPTIVHPSPPSDSRGYEKRVRVPSACSQRAKRGHKYWADDKKRATSGKKTTLGAKGSFLGIGVPRL